ncbi:MAG: carbamoyltransferase HypF [Flavobacteriaceae bacterium]|nr:MAG: carbamoyltransferase HypF [Flavobacteriaceae bacterium]
METTFRIVIQGRVQGVGFRPFVYRLAKAHQVRGRVSNNEDGVIIYATGTRDALMAFYREVTGSPPPVSQVINHYFEEIPREDPEGFFIVPSTRTERLNLQLTPDFALCAECKMELLDPKNRRYGYPFISCVNCGPRWALTETFPFEREHTSMEVFRMCPECLEEYGRPEDRRFHSQTNSCAACGIDFWVADPQGKRLDKPGETPFRQLAEILAEGRIIALKNTSGYLLCCDARNEGTVMSLRNKKKRPAKPFAVLYPSLDKLQEDLRVQPLEAEALSSAERPIVLLSSNHYMGQAALEAIAPGLDQLGVMLPYTGILALLAEAFPYPLIATSGNIHGSPICHSAANAREKLHEVADYFFEHSLKIIHPQDDSVIRFTRPPSRRIVLRRSRGFAPNYGRAVKKGAGSGYLALGGQLKSSIGYIPNDFLYVSEYLGNLDNFEVYERFTRTVSDFTTLFGQTPEALLLDSHPAYLSTQYGKELSRNWGIPAFSIPHHKAHFAAVLGEHGLFDQNDPVLGVIWDGTGYGEDGQIWGGEFFRYERGAIRRVGQFEYFEWLSGDKMAREPRLSLFSLFDGEDPWVRTKFTDAEWRLFGQLKASNRLKTSSAGRLFDAASSLLGFCDLNSFEAEAAMLLESACNGFDLKKAQSLVTLNTKGNIPSQKLIGSIQEARIAGHPPSQIAGDFIFTLASLILEKAEQQSVRKLAFSGGVFQNARLVGLLDHLNPGFELFFHEEFSPNDENIPFGQLMYHLNCT